MRPGDTLELDFEERRKVLTVSALNREARLLVERTFGTVWVEGEISNLSRPSSGHLYWSLKDGQAQVRCAMFRQANRALELALDNGQQILVRARVSFYEARGEFQLIVDYVEEAGEGLLRRKFDELKKRLEAEGLFDPARKKVPPRIPRRIGVVTSPTGAAIRDVLTALRRRFPAVEVLIYPTAVQGAGAAREIARMLALADKRRDCDVLILTRGGGSLEDLWAFNEEPVARAVAAAAIPVIVGVGHETDFTIADFVADVRAPTPSQAAELAVPDCADWTRRLDRAAAHLERAAARRIGGDAQRLAALAHRLHRCHPGVTLRQHAQRIDELEVRLKRGLERALSERRARVARLAAAVAAANPQHRVAAARQRWLWMSQRLEQAMSQRVVRLSHRLMVADRALRSLSPLATLDRGYAIVARSDDGRLVTDSASIAPGTGIAVRLARGRIAATVDAALPADEDASGDGGS
ncbi:MAG: exodeoxyribonuclease VII large subunit [Gammaproteobacteria bacterium]|nr:exodeoxyribonuclease VII large subunit [Gammaproteobacteria bacterium]